jgi:hypothetical protein
MLFNVSDEIFDVDDKDVIDSKTIENLLSYYDINSPIFLNVHIDDWYQYLDFLDYHQPTLAALKVIDYLDNVQQARLWCELQYMVLRKHKDMKNIYDPNTFIGILTQTINRYSEFIVDDVLPFKLLTTFEGILRRIKSMGNKELSFDHVRDIVNTLFSQHIAKLHYETHRFKSVPDIPLEFVDDIERNKFILQIDNDTYRAIDDDIILHDDDWRYYSKDYSSFKTRLMDDAAFISPRIAAYYSGIKIYKLHPKNFVMCPNDKPHLSYHKGILIGQTSAIYYASCQNEPKPRGKNIQPIDVYNPNSKYKPFEGFYPEHDIEIGGEYKLMTYNLPCLYDRDYYLYLPYEYDPIAKIVYAFSV